MKYLVIKILAVIVVLGLFEYCTAPDDTASLINIEGNVVDQSNGAAVENAIVRLFSPDSEKVDQTDSAGAFLFTLGVDSTVDLSLIISKEGYVADTIDALGIPERDVTFSAIYLVPTTSGGSGDSTIIPPPVGSTGPSNILLAGVSAQVVTVIGSGGADNTTLAFQVLDSTGYPVGADIVVAFAMGSSPGGGEYLSPSAAYTDDAGLVSVNLVSGTVAGVVQVVASVGTTIKSQAIPITIHGGLPDATHFGVVSAKVNFPGYNHWGLSNMITAFVGDKYGNFCTPGTAVYFTTDGGMIEGSGLTKNGVCAVALISAPPKPTHPVLGPGFATIKARTANDKNETIEDSVIVLFSGAPIISALNPLTVNVPHQGSQSFSFSVTDENGNPLSAGTSISVLVEGGNVVAIGDVGISLYDTQAKGSGITTFDFTLSDSDTALAVPADVRVVVATSGANGNARQVLEGSGS